MKKNLKKVLLFVFAVITAIICMSFTSSAAYEKGFYYEVYKGNAYIDSYDGSASSVTIPSKIGGYTVISVSFGSRFNSNYDKITTITIPDTVTTVGDFSYCYNLKKINISANVKNISADSFYGTAFYNNKSNWDNGALYLGKYLLAVDTASTTYSIKSGTTVIASSAFKFCEGSGESYNDNYTTTGTTTSPATTGSGDSSSKPENIKLTNNVELKTLKIPASVRYIGANAFSTCSSLGKVYAESAASWFKIEFASYSANPVYYASKLYFNNKLARDIVVPSGITKINDYAFFGYERMKTLELSDTVTEIGNYAFYYCESLATLKTAKALKKIGLQAFEGCNYIESIYTPDIKSWLNISYVYTETSIFGYINYLGYSWGGQYNLYVGGKLAKSVVVPSSVKKINPYAFYSCKSIESITIPSSVTSIGDYAFYNCSNLKNVYASDVASWCKIKFGSNASPMIPAKNLYFNKKLATTITIPSTVKKITRGTFNSVDCLETLIIPKTVTDINFYAFENCNNLKSICYAGAKDDWYEIEFKHKAIVYYNGLKKPSTVTTLSASQTSSAVTLKWSKTSGASGYAVYKYNTKTKKYEKLKTTTSLTYTVSNLTAGTIYKFKVRSYASKGGQTFWGNYSKEFETATKPATPTLKVTSTSKGKANLNWTNVAGESGYQIYYSYSKDKDFVKYSTPKANTSKATVSGLTSGKTCYFRVRAYIKTASGNVYGAYKTVSAKVK